jgi:hypothetical protein
MEEPQQSLVDQRAGGRSPPALSLLFGLACWGADVAKERAREWSTRARVAPAPEIARGIRARGLIFGLSMEATRQLRHVLAEVRAGATPMADRLAKLGKPVLLIPGVRGVLQRTTELARNFERDLSRIAAQGEAEAARCQALARVGLGEVVDRAVKRVAGASEVREVLVNQSEGLMGEAVLEVRQRAKRADSMLESAVRSLMHGKWPRAEDADASAEGH